MKKNSTVLLICDMLNTFEFPEASMLYPQALAAARYIKKLKQQCKRRGVPVIYVNDNFGNWNSQWTVIYKTCTKSHCMGRRIAELLKPTKDDYFILKPKHSGFHMSSLEALLETLNAQRLIITGIAGNIFVLFTAHDAHMREYKVIVPEEGMASNTTADHRSALQNLKTLQIPTRLGGTWNTPPLRY